VGADDRFPHSTNLRGARLGVSITAQGDEAMSMLNRRNALTAVIVVGALGLAVILGLALAELVRVMS
jgi:Zn-dependent alcohol dehydrogenase